MITFLIIIILSAILIILIALLLIFLLFLFDAFLDLPYVATRKEKIPTIIKLAGVKKGEIAIDLGSGDGRLLFAAAKLGANAIGYELNPFLVLFTNLKARLLHLRGEVRSSTREHLGGVFVIRKDLWRANLKEANVIFVYGRAKTMPKFEAFLYKKAKKGTRLIVNTDKTVPFPTKKPTKSENGIFLYKI